MEFEIGVQRVDWERGRLARNEREARKSARDLSSEQTAGLRRVAGQSPQQIEKRLLGTPNDARAPSNKLMRFMRKRVSPAGVREPYASVRFAD